MKLALVFLSICVAASLQQRFYWPNPRFAQPNPYMSYMFDENHLPLLSLGDDVDEESIHPAEVGRLFSHP